MSVRIITGSRRKQSLLTPESGPMRPTRTRIRESAFTLLSDQDFTWHEKLIVADICCGTGAYGLEALSRGAGFCYFIDSSPKWAEENVIKLKFDEQAKVMRADARRLRLPDDKRPDVVFLDPPYGYDIELDVLKNAPKIGKAGSIWLIETAPENSAALKSNTGFTLIKQRDYGASTLTILKQN